MRGTLLTSKEGKSKGLGYTANMTFD